jgi:predicted RND superfamily exporter protein
LVWVEEFQIFKTNMMSKFKQLSEKIQKKQGVSEKSANAIAATIGRNKYGANVFTKLAVKANKGKNKK